MSKPRVSVVIRAKDEAASIGRVLELLAQQVPPPAEVVVVDSGSSDGTVDIARRAQARVIEIPAASFTFGGSLNIGCEASTGDIVVALSAHAFPTSRGWLARMAAAFEDDSVACACGHRYSPTGAPLQEAINQDLQLATRYPLWGYSNAAGAFRRELWSERGFRAEMPATEDKDWALHWLGRGYVCRLDPELEVDHDHSKDGLRDQFRRAQRELEGLAMMPLDMSPYTLRDLLNVWWTDRGSYRSDTRARLSHRRASRLLGEYVGRRRAARRKHG
jgi:rhamnosyltransferase